MPQLRELTTTRLNLAPLADGIEATCREEGLSLRQAALRLGLTPSTLTRVRQGKRPDAEALAVLAAWTRVPVEALLPPDDPARRLIATASKAEAPGSSAAKVSRRQRGRRSKGRARAQA